MRRFVSGPLAAARQDSSVLPELIEAWGNSGWSALEEYLRMGVEHTLDANGAVLECGTGLSTLLFGTVAHRRGVEYWALEHLPEWSERVGRQLKRYGANKVQVCTAPLRSYSDFDWYDPPLHRMPSGFSLVICDGPPSRTSGGRYGLAPVMGSRLNPGCVILLDDAEREHECEVALRWQAELAADAAFIDGSKPLIRLVVRGR
jgi:hypothetical protein